MNRVGGQTILSLWEIRYAPSQLIGARAGPSNRSARRQSSVLEIFGVHGPGCDPVHGRIHTVMPSRGCLYGDFLCV